MNKKEISKNFLKSEATLKDAMLLLDSGIYGVVLIVGDGNLLRGMLTDGDIRRALLGGASLNDSVKTHMNKNFTVGSSSKDHEENVKLLSDIKKHLPIVDKNGVVVDMISWAEIWRLPVTEPYLGGNELKYVSDCIRSNWISSQGHYVGRFENSFEEYLSIDKAICASSGTAALHLSLLAAGVGAGDEVILPNLTFGACGNVVINCGAKPVYVDIVEETWTINPNLIEEKITDKTKVIMPVHLYGQPCHMDEIMDIAEKHNLIVIEDCAESLGAKYKNRFTGTIGHIGCFSFFANKIITTGEGGMVITNDSSLSDKILQLRDHGMRKDKRYWHEVAGLNYRMTNIQAAIGVAQMEVLDKFLENRNAIINRYRDNLRDIKGITLPPENDWSYNINWLYSILIDDNELHINAEELINKLSLEGIETRRFFYPLNIQPPFKSEGSYPVSEKISQRGISLPTGNDISIEEVDKVTNAIKQIISNTNLLKGTN